MEQKFQFKTNINCSGCVEKVTPYLDSEMGIKNWSVDTNNKDKILSVTAEGLTEAEVAAVIRQAGYKAESLTE